MNRLAKLEEALAHPEAFFAVFNSLKDLPSAEVREIAREFTKRSARSKADAQAHLDSPLRPDDGDREGQVS